MNPAIELTKIILGKELPNDYSLIFLSFVLFCIIFFVWSLYFVIYKGGIEELKKIEWLSFRDTFITSINIVLFIVISSLILFGFDFVLNELVNLILTYGKQ